MMWAVRYLEVSKIVALLLSFLVATLLLRFGAKFYGIEGSLPKSVLAVFGGGIVASLLLTLPAGPVFAALAYLYIVKSVLGLNWPKAIVLFCFIVMVELATYSAFLHFFPISQFLAGNFKIS